MDVGVKVVVGLLIAYAVFRAGFWLLKGFAGGSPPAPDLGSMRKVDLRYRCSICGAEVRMTVAASEDPEPPRHCQEDMDLVAPRFE